MTILTSQIALDMVLRIEELQRQIDAVYSEARDFEGENNDNVIQEGVDARARQREAASDAEAYIGSFDFDDEGNRIAAPAEPAWAGVSRKLRQVAGSDARVMKQVAIIDRLVKLCEERGVPLVSRPELEAAMGPEADA